MKTANLFTRILTGSAAAAVLAAPLVAAPRLTAQQQLDKALAGRVAGKPVNCIDPRVNDSTLVIDKTAIVYGSGRTVYLQRPVNAESLSDDDIMVTRLWGNGQLCNIDTVSLIDRSGGFYRGFVGLNEFVPYTRVAARD
jgi:hypothetical protein